MAKGITAPQSGVSGLAYACSGSARHSPGRSPYDVVDGLERRLPLRAVFRAPRQHRRGGGAAEGDAAGDGGGPRRRPEGVGEIGGEVGGLQRIERRQDIVRGLRDGGVGIGVRRRRRRAQ